MILSGTYMNRDHFELFWNTHMLFGPFVVINVIHGKGWLGEKRGVDGVLMGCLRCVLIGCFKKGQVGWRKCSSSDNTRVLSSPMGNCITFCLPPFSLHSVCFLLPTFCPLLPTFHPLPLLLCPTTTTTAIAVGPNYWKWLTVPGGIYFIERMYRLYLERCNIYLVDATFMTNKGKWFISYL